MSKTNNPMVKIPIPTIYECQRCNKEWLQRVLAVYDADGLKIKKVKGSPKPKNCTNCKSSSWEIPRG